MADNLPNTLELSSHPAESTIAHKPSEDVSSEGGSYFSYAIGRSDLVWSLEQVRSELQSRAASFLQEIDGQSNDLSQLGRLQRDILIALAKYETLRAAAEESYDELLDLQDQVRSLRAATQRSSE